MKRVWRTVLVGLLVLLLGGCASHNQTPDKKADKISNFKIGVLLIGDETEAYSKAHIDGIKKAAKALKISEENIKWMERVEESEDCFEKTGELVDEGCSLIISDSYRLQDYMEEAAEKFPEVSFVAMAGDYAAISGLNNFYNAYTKVYEARYVSGVVAGMKLAELDAQGKIPKEGYNESGKVRVGYIGTVSCPEVVSGYTAFYLGICSVFPNAALEVQYTNSWSDDDGEATAADWLLKSGCVMFGQHADSIGIAETIEHALENGQTAYCVGYNADALGVAPKAALTSVTNDWSVYYKALFASALTGTEIPQDWSKGMEDGAVAITKLGPDVAKGTAQKIADVQNEIKEGTLHVFDSSTFTVEGRQITPEDAMVDLSYKEGEDGSVIYEGPKLSALVTDKLGSYFEESELRSAPYFNLKIDGIIELNALTSEEES